MKSLNPLLILLLFLSLQCKTQENDKRQLAINLNDKAIDLMYMNPDSALILLDSAIKLDSQYAMAYSNKVTLQCQRGEYHKAIETIKKRILLDPEQAESVMFLGMLFEKTGQNAYAKAEYLKAVDLFTIRLQKNDKYKSGNRLNRSIALILLGNEEGMKELNKLIAENPNDEILSMLKDFDRNKYIEEILQTY